jgi:Collagen triple helix repeat (20 copies)
MKIAAPITAGCLVAVAIAIGAVAIPANAADGPVILGQSSHTSAGIKYYDTQFQGGGHVVTNLVNSINAKNAAQDKAIAKGTKGPKGDTGAVGPTGATGLPGPVGRTGAAGPSGLAGAYYSLAKYDVGDTNGGAIATVKCSAPTDVAISGGVQELGAAGAPDNNQANNVPVASSFPGHMDWSTNTPVAGSTDGWIIQFGTQTAAAPKYVDIYALCVPGATIPVNTTYAQSTDG